MKILCEFCSSVRQVTHATSSATESVLMFKNSLLAVDEGFGPRLRAETRAESLPALAWGGSCSRDQGSVGEVVWWWGGEHQGRLID